MHKFKTLKDINIKNKRVLLRVDFNVPIGKDGKIDKAEGWRIEAVIPTLRYLIKQQAKIILISHLGRPNGRVDKKYSLKPIALVLRKILKKKILFSSEVIGKKVEKKIQKMDFGDILMLENIRFLTGEENNSPKLAKDLAKLVDFYINDGFAVSHRLHASIVGIPKYLVKLESGAPFAVGLLFEKEIKELDKIVKEPKRPLVAIIGGAKISTKITVINKFLKIADKVLVAGALANDIFAFQGLNMRRSIIDEKSFKEVKKIDLKNPKLFLPVDLVSWDGKNVFYREINEVGKNEKVLDIGSKTINLFSEIIKNAGTIIWNGPLGLTEQKPFDRGTREIIEAIAKSRAYSVVGGGDTVTFIREIKKEKIFNHLSTGGGALLDYLVGKTLPGIEAIEECKRFGK